MMDTESYIGLPPWTISATLPPHSEERQRRRERIGPIVAGMQAGTINPHHLTENIAELVECLRAEGNDLFMEKEYFQAYDTYTTGIVILVKRRERDKRILEVLLTNRACSLLKMDFFMACINDCNMALNLNSQNLKAHYRRALALKLTGNYKDALLAAEDGQKKALEQNKKTDVKEFDELLCEIRCLRDAVVQNFRVNDLSDIPANPVLSEERQRWWKNFNALQQTVWDPANASQWEHMMNPDRLLTLMAEMEREARTIMGERGYRTAYGLFVSVLRMIKHIEVVNFREIDRTIISDIFLQKAICALKMDDYGKAIEDCDLALQLNKDNVEALYRKAVALKTKRDYGSALSVALKVCWKATERKDSNLVKLCDVLTREIESHLIVVDSEVSSKTTGRSSPRVAEASGIDRKPESTPQTTTPSKAKKRWKKKAPLAADTAEKAEKTVKDGSGAADDCILYRRDDTVSDGAELKHSNVSENGDQYADDCILYKRDETVSDILLKRNSSKKGLLNEKGDPSANGDLKGIAGLRPSSGSDKGDLSEKGDLKGGGTVPRSNSSSKKGGPSEKGKPSVTAEPKPTSSSENGSKGDLQGKADASAKGDGKELKPVPPKTSVAQQPACSVPQVKPNETSGSTAKFPVLASASSGVVSQTKSTVVVTTAASFRPVATASKDVKSSPQLGHFIQPVESTAAQARPVSSASSAVLSRSTKTDDFIFGPEARVLSSASSNQSKETDNILSTASGSSPQPAKAASSKSITQSPAVVMPAKAASSKSITQCPAVVMPAKAKAARSKSTTQCATAVAQPSKPVAVSSSLQQSVPSVVNSASNPAPIKPALLPKNLSEFAKPLLFSDAAHSAPQPVRPLMSVSGLSLVKSSEEQQRVEENAKPALLSKNLSELTKPLLFSDAAHSAAQPVRPLMSLPGLSQVKSDQQRVEENAGEPVATTPKKKKKKKSKSRASSPAPVGGAPSSAPLNPLPPPPFPLCDTCNFRLACVQCFKENSAPLSVAHKCNEDILIVQNRKTQRWVVVRECNTQVRMGGGYVMCWHVIAGTQCQRGTACTFAHNAEELKLWNLQKAGGSFRVDAFVANNRSPGNLSVYTVESVYRKYEGELRMICGACWNEKKLIMTQDLSQAKCNKGVHDLRMSRLLAHRSKELRVTMIGKRPFPSRKAFFNICYEKQFCRRKFGCVNAHSEIECDVWYVERDTGLKQEQIINEWYKIKDKDRPSVASSNQAPERSVPTTSSADECPYKLAKACDLCLKKGRLDLNPSNGDRCSSGHTWKINTIFVILPLKKVVKRLPYRIPMNNKFTICHFVDNCHQGNACQFAHSNEEIRLWKWMVANKVMTLEAAMEKQPKRMARLARTLSSVSLDERRSSTTSEPAWNIPTPTVVSSLLGQDESFYCCYCSLVCNSHAQLEAHCSSSRHILNVNSDRDRQWNYHQPPWNVQNGNYRLCIYHLDRRCRYSNVPEANNLCTYAHSQEELDEWIERYKWRQMKRKIAIDENLFSYMDRLLEEYNNSGTGAVLSESLNGVRVTCSSQLAYVSEDKNAEKTWTFQVESPGLVMTKVALLYHESRLHFTLNGIQNRGAQISSGDDFRARDHVYNVEVRFKGGLFGSFKQWVAFDFGQRPVLVQKLSVDLGLRDVQQKVKKLRKNLHLDRWTPQNRTIIKYPSDLQVVDEFNQKLLAVYKAPTSTEIMQQVIGHELNQHNYKFKMHSLIDLEELTQTRIISGYNVVSTIHVQNCVGDEMAGFRFSQGGQLFAQVPLKNQLIEGSLISSSVQSVLLAPSEDQTNRVFEAVIAEMDKRSLQGSDFVVLSLSPRCVTDLALKHDVKREMEIQFEINRNLFCQMHYAIDEMQKVEIIFPDIRKIHTTVGERYKLNSSTSKLNDDQKVILNYVSRRRQNFPPPLVVYGPFGTGKTETMAEAAILLTTNNSDVRILICTKTNQAADEYILRHFYPHVNRSDTAKMSFVRVYHRTRKISTIDPKARCHSLLSGDGSSFRDPTQDDILHNQIVVTTLITSLVIAELKLRGCFTHIFIDEAAQVNECHAVIPLCLANDRTCIVLAGDHIQMADPIYSTEAKDQGFHLSLVERLMSLYDRTPSDPTHTPKVLLKANYRNHPDIIKFVAQVFYGGEDSLKAKSVQADVAEFPPLAFYAANGREVRDPNSTSYYNEAEVMEVVEQVNRVLERWPKEWGERQADQILVTTPYTDQVNRIRSQMRRHRNRALGSVVVLRVQNVPGREFRAVFISTVRTRHLIEECDPSEQIEDNDYGFLSDCKILNSAFTRAKSFLAVVADPVALCSIGSCSKIWHQFFKYCGQRAGGINPPQMDLNTIRLQYEAFLDASELPRRRATAADDDETEILEPFDMKSLLDLEDWNRDYQLEPDDIIRQLVREGLEGSEGAQTGRGFLEDGLIQSENIRVQEREGHVLVSYRGNEERVRGSGVRLNDQNCDDEYVSSDEDNETDAVYDSAEPRKLLKSQPEKYKRCIINIDSTKNIFARPLDKPCRFKRVKIASRRLCGCAFSGDEVVIEILRADDSEVQREKDRVAFGQVIGILKHAMNPKYRLFVCTVEEGNTGVMVPINKGIPRIYNLEQKNRPRTRSNQVAVYRFFKGGRIQFHHYENVNEFDALSKLFVVRFLKWDPKFPLPLGIVVQIIPPGTSVDEAMVILNIEHDIPHSFKTETESEVERLFPVGYTLPNASLKGRVDYREKLAFTIDASTSTDLDDALSFEQISSSQFQVVVHISDVSYFLDKAVKTDEETAKRGSSFYQAAGSPIHMLPHRLSSDLCSLLPDQDRLTVSVFFTIDEAAEILNVEVKRSVIRSKLRLDYETVNAIVSEGVMADPSVAVPDDLVFKLLMLHRIAQKWRQNRLGTLASYHSVEPKWLEGAKAHLLVEEFMVTANHHVAVLLMEKFPLETPLRNQLPPNELELEEWRQRFGREARNTIALTRPYNTNGEVCRCTGKCECVNVVYDNKEMELTRPILESIKRAYSEDDMEFLRTLVVCPEYHPQLSIALLYLQFLSDKSQYVCSGDVSEDERSHFSLNLPAYTHFTSPIRRYLDVVVHRLLGALIDDRACVYTKVQVSDLCLECTDASRRAAKFEEASKLVHVCQFLMEKPIVVFPVIEVVDVNELRLACPTLRHLLRSKLKVRSAWLQPSEKPELLPDGHRMRLKWSQRIYDATIETSERSIRLPKDGELNPDKHIVKVDSDLWRELLAAVMNETESSEIDPKVNALLQSAKTTPGAAGFEDEILTSEGLLRFAKHFCEFSMLFRESGVVRVQLTVELSRGLLVPNVQLLSLNKSCEMCTEHRRDAVACFASKNARKATRTFYESIYDYQDLWLPVLAIEAASSAVLNDIPATIHNVLIIWHEEHSSRGAAYIGILKLGFRFCLEREFNFPLRRKQVDERERSYYNEDEESCSGYFCIRYVNIKARVPNTELDLTGVDEVDEPHTWVGHCVMTHASADEDKTVVTVKLRLNTSGKLPRELLGKQNSRLATAEWIAKPLPDWRMEVAVNGLDEAGRLAECIALGHDPPSFDKFYLEMVRRWVDWEPPGQNVANVTQRNAIKHSMTQPFSLIQGPPGTGKTVVAVQLAYLFRKVNETLPDSFNNDSQVHPQVMCCGPSNKSVDVIAGHLMRMKIPDTLIIRVYSQKVEKEDFPIPNQLFLFKKKYKLEDRVRDSELRQISLHHMIRDDNYNTNARFLREMDELFREKPDEVTYEDIEKYRGVVKTAESALLKLADIILLTCSTSGAPRFRINGINVFQLIIDECGMCMEPESLIPIVASKAKQVVLLGDHQQLQPIVLENRARKRGLGESMFERYSKAARMLTTQYRMHEAIAEFPSKQFYDGRLTAGKDEQRQPSRLPFWPAGGSSPIALIHCVGKEEALAVDAEEGGEQSKTNGVEALKAVFVVRQLVEKYGVPAKSIAVLSQYRAQSTQISKKLLNSSTLKEVTAQTVVAAQGSEWDYVVLSTVRSLPEIEIERRPSLNWKRKHLGFVADFHQINVAITRARKGLIIIGNRLLLGCDEMWRNLIAHYESRHKIVEDAATFMRDA